MYWLFQKNEKQNIWFQEQKDLLNGILIHNINIINEMMQIKDFLPRHLLMSTKSCWFYSFCVSVDEMEADWMDRIRRCIWSLFGWSLDGEVKTTEDYKSLLELQVQ